MFLRLASVNISSRFVLQFSSRRVWCVIISVSSVDVVRSFRRFFRESSSCCGVKALVRYRGGPPTTRA